MREHIKTGKKISDELSDEMVSRFQKGSLDLTKLNELENEKWVSLSWLKEQIESDLKLWEEKKEGDDIDTTAIRILSWVLRLLEEKE